MVTELRSPELVEMEKEALSNWKFWIKVEQNVLKQKKIKSSGLRKGMKILSFSML